mmetsp:Transcript_75857/g.201547  ORF Transcript_75857/g.201547 Transcript_75857/m.201547 type:complete len:210 (+) Transcript_75857:114-743(+)
MTPRPRSARALATRCCWRGIWAAVPWPRATLRRYPAATQATSACWQIGRPHQRWLPTLLRPAKPPRALMFSRVVLGCWSCPTGSTTCASTSWRPARRSPRLSSVGAYESRRSARASSWVYAAGGVGARSTSSQASTTARRGPCWTDGAATSLAPWCSAGRSRSPADAEVLPSTSSGRSSEPRRVDLRRSGQPESSPWRPGCSGQWAVLV